MGSGQRCGNWPGFRSGTNGAVDIGGAEKADRLLQRFAVDRQRLAELRQLPVAIILVQRHQQPFTIAKVVVGDRLGHVGAFGQVAKGQRLRALLTNDSARNLQQLHAAVLFS